MLEPDLLGGWALVRETGQIGGRSSCGASSTWTRPARWPRFEHARDAQLKKGFQLMFAQGAEAPR
jgi:hypothetical protein